MSMMSAVSAGGENICGTEAGEIMLFGFRVIVDPIRKSVSLNDLSQYVQKQDLLNNINSEKDVPAGYVSADEAVHLNSSSFSATGNTAAPNNSNNRERKRGVPWTEDEHKLFLLGLQKVGKGDWRGISRNFVKTRTPTQVASHAQKYFLRRSNLNRRRRRSSLFDITTDTVASSPGTDRLISPAPSVQPIAPVPQESTAFYPGTISSANVLPSSPSNQNITATVSQDSYRPSDAQSSNLMLPAIGKSVADFDLNENWLSLSMSSDRSNSGFTVGNRDGIINVA